MPRFSLLDAAAWTALAVVLPGVAAWISSELCYTSDEFFTAAIRGAKTSSGRYLAFAMSHLVTVSPSWVGLAVYRGLLASKLSPPQRGRTFIWDGSVLLNSLVVCQVYYLMPMRPAGLIVAFIELAGFALVVCVSWWVRRFADRSYSRLSARMQFVTRIGFVAVSLGMAGGGWESLRYFMGV